MIKRIKELLFSFFLIFSLFSCNNVTYSFYDVTGYNLNEINKVMYDQGKTQSWLGEFLGDYTKFLDIKYVKIDSDNALNEYIDASENYNFGFYIEYKENKYEEIGPAAFYVYNNKIYTVGNDNNLYRSKNYVSLVEIKTEAEGTSPHSEISSSSYTNTISMTANYDYGLHIENKATLLLDGVLPFFDPSKFKIDKIVAGDILDIEYTGEFIIRESYPATLDKKSCEIVSVKIKEAEIHEFEILSIPGSGDLDIVPIDHNIYNYRFNTNYVVSEDGTYLDYRELDYGIKIFGTIPKNDDGLKVMALYSYNPREDDSHIKYVKNHQDPTCQKEGYNIIGCYCCEADIYVPIAKVYCSYDENDICIWCKNKKSTTHFIRVNNIEKENGYIINSKEELDILFSEFDQKTIDSFDEEYFISSSLIVISKIESSGSISHEVKKVIVDNGFIDIVIERNIPIYGTCDMAYWLILIEINQKITKDYELKLNYVAVEELID